MRQVFEQAGRSGNGETWHAILRTELDAHARVHGLAPTSETMRGGELSVTYQLRRTWIDFDAEAGGVLVCAGDAALLGLMRSIYEQACRDPVRLRKLIAQVPGDEWDD